MAAVVEALAVAGHVAAGLVLAAGVEKVVWPSVARDALALTRLPAATALTRMLGTAEAGLALVVIVAGGRAVFAALAAAYAVFVVVGARQRRAGRGCGCFSTSTTTVGGLHLGVDAVAAVTAALAAWYAVPGLAAVVGGAPLATVVSLGLVVLGVVLARLALTALPELLAVGARVEAEVTR